MNNYHKILGPPGTGKTTHLIDLVGKAINTGMKPEDICFITFSRAGILEAKERAKQKFNLTHDDLRNFTTIHAMCFRALQLSRDRVFSGKILGVFAKQLGLKLTWETDEGVYVTTKDDKIMNIINYAEVTKQDLKVVWENYKDNVPWYELIRVYKAMQEFKLKNKLVSYNDMLVKVAQDTEIKLPSFKCLFVDEAQDSSTIQWNVIKNKLLGQVENVYFAGDDDQAIFTWAGANVDEFIELEAETTVLGQSFRCPKLVQGIADRVTNRMAKRLEKSWKPIDSVGNVQVIQHLYDIDMSKDKWLLLGRNRAILKHFEKDLRAKGYYYEMKDSSMNSRAWKPSIDLDFFNLVQKYWYFQEYRMSDKKSLLELLAHTKLAEKIQINKSEIPDFITSQNTPYEIKKYFDTYDWPEGIITYPFNSKRYIQAMIKRGEKLSEVPRTRLSTIHSIKGGECKNVILSLDLSAASYEALQNKNSRDEELRVLYVGLTRSSENLYLLYPQTNMNYLEYLKK